jgi:2-C-methyl-D-erythritol 4-phosphate cytidylyltransferase
VNAFERAGAIERIVLAVVPDRLQDAESLARTEGWRKTQVVSAQSDWREALRAGLDCLASKSYETAAANPLVVVHEAARPLVTAELIAAGLAAASTTGAAVAGEPVKETIKRVRDGRIVETIPRENLIRAQTPLVFAADLLAIALAGVSSSQAPTAPTGLVPAAVRADIPVTSFAGSPENLLVQTTDDLAVAVALLQRRGSATQSAKE